MLDQDMTVLGVSQYDFTTDEGDHLKGCKVICLSDVDQNKDFVGKDVIKLNAPYGIINKFRGAKLPGVFNLSLQMKTSGNKAVLSVVDVLAAAHATD